MLYPFVRPAYLALETGQRKELCSNSYKICTALSSWTARSKQTVLDLMNKVMTAFSFIHQDLSTVYDELEESNPIQTIPYSVIDCVRAYFEQFYVIKGRKLCLPSVSGVSSSQPASAPAITTQPKTKAKVRAITEEIWWVVRVKNEYRMCKLTFDRGEYWEMVEYQGGKVHNPQYRFPKYDNRVVYEFKEHITPSMFSDKIAEAVQIRRTALLKQAQELLLRYDTVLIARHLTGGTLVGGVEEEDDTYWYLDTYNEHGERIFYGDTRWNLEKKSRCTVVQILRRK